MAGSSLLALLDDIATLLDDVSVMTKVAAKKTAGVLGDDLALNAQQVSGVKADRELPVVWAVCKGSLVNKLILVPAALLIAAFAPWAITPLLMLGGAFLCFEGFEKIAHRLLHSREEDQRERDQRREAVIDLTLDMKAFERAKIKGAVRTDFILSAEIIAITLGAVAGAPFLQQVLILCAIALAVTLGVYGLVAGIVKLDDLGLFLSQRGSALAQHLGRGILYAAPWLMKTLSVIGTAAMFTVGGAILVHGLPPVQSAIDSATAPLASTVLAFLAPALLSALFGIVIGGLLVGLQVGVKRLFPSADQ